MLSRLGALFNNSKQRGNKYISLITPFNEQQAHQGAQLRASTKKQGLSLGLGDIECALP